MGLTATLSLAAFAVALAGFCMWHQKRERPLGEVSLFPSTVIMAIALLVLVLAVAHLVSLTTGVPLKGRMGF